ncbi:uncharacterized protein BKA55DRAFT_575731 [Fusarium redolens]|uniref:Uncharacterized protein n=1 Tax=Fusarium redolens TaxID=48865 RepID=A0A9P9GJK8_FUSRE|nr:uncharacterized protein BKA55DRAFT_575731 [Fusarium redolens]KAH7240769.1 hypothetical protein BKA55DRAFT_575731 [Fusarium redolens]
MFLIFNQIISTQSQLVPRFLLRGSGDIHWHPCFGDFHLGNDSCLAKSQHAPNISIDSQS